MILSDAQITRSIDSGDLVIEPFSSQLVRPASVCLRLAGEYITMESHNPIDIRDPDTYPVNRTMVAPHGDGIMINPGETVLGSTIERISFSRRLAGRVENLSGLARLGLQVVLSGYVSPGFGEAEPSTLTLEMACFQRSPIIIYPGMRICHLVIWRLDEPALHGYDSQVGNYSHLNGPAPSHFFTDFQ
jgi:dCTP deaminase